MAYTCINLINCHLRRRTRYNHRISTDHYTLYNNTVWIAATPMIVGVAVVYEVGSTN